MVSWLSGLKHFPAKKEDLKTVPWVQIPHSPPKLKGSIAQLGEQMPGRHQVVGSTPTVIHQNIVPIV